MTIICFANISVKVGPGQWHLTPLSTIFQLYHGDQFLLVEKTGVLGENHWPVASHWQTLSHIVVSSTPRLSGIRTHVVSGVRPVLMAKVVINIK